MNVLKFEAWVIRAVSKISMVQDQVRVEQELMDHMLDQYEDLLSQGLSPAEAQEETVRAMGDPDVLAESLGLIHRPHWTTLQERSLKVLRFLVFLLPFFLFGRVLGGYFFADGYNQPNYSRYDPYISVSVMDNAGSGQRLLLVHPEDTAASDGYFFTVTKAALWHLESVDNEGRHQLDRLHFQLRVTSALPWAEFDDISRWFYAVDSLGNVYHAAYETGAAKVPAITGSVYHAGPLTYIHDMYLTDYVSQDAQWIDLCYHRAGRDIVLRIDLTGGIT